MNVLIVSPWSEPKVGGVVKTISELARGLAASGIDVRILIGGDANAIEEIEPTGSIPTYAMRLRSPQPYGGGPRDFIASAVFLLPTLIRLRRFLLDHRIDVVNVHFPSSQYFYFCLLKSMLPMTLLASVHGSDIRVHFSWGRLNRWLTRCLLQRSDAIVACSQELLDYTLTTLEVPAHGATEVIYGGVDSHWLEAIKPADTSDDRPYIMVIGALREVKGIDILIQAIAHLGERFDRYRLMIIGDGPLRRELEDLSRSLKLDDRVEFMGVVGHGRLPELLAGSLFTVISSRNEGLPLVAFEALATGKPVVACDAGGLPELIEHEVNGLLFPAEDVEALSRCIARLLDNPDERTRMGSRGADQVRRHYTWDATTKQYISLIERIGSARHE